MSNAVLRALAPPYCSFKENYWHQAKGTEYKRKSMQTIMNKHDIIVWKPWTREYKIKLGGFLLEGLAKSSGWFTNVVIQQNKKLLTLLLQINLISIKKK